MTYTEKELNQFLHGISLSLLSKKSAQHWRYDEETAKEIEWLEALERKVRADKADRKTENSSEKPNNCETCKYESLASYEGACDDCTDISGSPSNYEPKSEPTTEDSPTVDWKDQMWKEAVKTEPQTDCKVCLYRNIPKDSPHCMSCKNNSKFERDWSAEPQTERSE